MIKKQIKSNLKSNQTSLCLFVIYLRVLSNILCHTEPIINLAAVTKSQLDEHVVYVIKISLKATFKSTFSISSDLSIRYKLKVLLESLIKWTAWFYENNNIKRCLYRNTLLTLHLLSTIYFSILIKNTYSLTFNVFFIWLTWYDKNYVFTFYFF